MKRLEIIATIARRFALMDSTNPVSIETFPHVADDEFAEGETAWRVSVYFGSEAKRAEGVGKTLEDATGKALASVGDALRKWRRILTEDHTRAGKRLSECDAMLTKLGGIEP